MRNAAAALPTLALVVGLGACGGSGDSDRSQFRVAGGSKPQVAEVPGQGSLTAYVPKAEPLRARPGGRVVARLRPRTEFGSPRVLAVVRRSGAWLGVLASELPNRRVGWIPAATAKLMRAPYSLQIDLSQRELVVLRAGRAVLRTRVAIGKPSAPTPRGVFAVTDRLYTRGDSPYGCCVLATTAHQPHVPQNWGGGDRIAIHSTLDPASIGQPISLGCLRADTFHMRKLVKLIPLGAPVRVQA